MKRVYYSGFIPVNEYDNRLPALKQPPLVRENRLYQADWLLRFYQFKVDEIVNDTYPDLDLEVDPKLGWALRHPEQFPVDINKVGLRDASSCTWYRGEVGEIDCRFPPLFPLGDGTVEEDGDRDVRKPSISFPATNCLSVRLTKCRLRLSVKS